MTTAPDDHFRPLPHLLALGAAGAITAVVFFSVAYLWLIPPPATEAPPDPSPSTQVLEIQEMPPPASNDAVWGSSPTSAADEEASPMLAATPEQEQPALKAAAFENAFVPPARITHPKRVRVVRYQRQVTERHRAMLSG